MGYLFDFNMPIAGYILLYGPLKSFTVGEPRHMKGNFNQPIFNGIDG